MNNISQKTWGLESLNYSRVKTNFTSNSLNTSGLNFKPALNQDTVSFTSTNRPQPKVSENTAKANNQNKKWIPNPLNNSCNNANNTTGIKAAKLSKINSDSSPNKIASFTRITELETSEALRIANKVNIFRLMKHVNALADGKMQGRGVGQKGIEIAKEYIANEFNQYKLKPIEKLGLKDYFQDFQMNGYHTSSIKKAKYTHGDINYFKMGAMTKTSNVIGMIEGSETPDQYMIIVAHYDHLGKDKEKGIFYPGANDDASGVSAMLEIARIMSEEKPPKKSVIFAALSGEEFCCQGATELSKELNSAGIGKNSEVLNLEMLGAEKGNKLDIWDENKKGTEGIVRNLEKVGELFNTKMNIIRKSTPGQDAKEFNSNDIPAVCTAWDYKQAINHPTYHTAQDTPDRINKKIYKRATKILAAASYLNANESATYKEYDSSKKTTELIA